MRFRAKGLGSFVASHRLLVLAACVLLAILAVVIVLRPADAARFSYRAMYINSARAGDTTHYIITLAYPTASPVGSLRMEFCDNPIPSLPCNIPDGLDVSSGVLSDQSGSTDGFSITTQTQNLIILSRTPELPGGGNTSYRFDDVVNPSDEVQDFYVRITSHSTTDGTGPIVDFGSVANTTTPEVGIITQVPPILIFCVAAQIHDDDCEDAEGNFVDFGELDSGQTYYTTSQIQARTNAFYGYSITVTGTTVTSGIRAIPALTVPTQSFVGVGQFGLNLAVNNTPSVGASPVGDGTNALINPQYDQPDHFLFNGGDILVTSDTVTRTRKFTASYILNVPENQPPGVYSTTITYVAMAGF